MTPSGWRDCSDHDLTVAATLGELGAFDELVRRYRPAVMTVARRIVGSEAAEDVAQDALLLAFKALPQLDDPERLGPWLYAIARHRALRFVQKQTNKEETGHSEFDRLILEHTPELSRQPAEDVERAERQAEVREALDHLPEPLQVVVVLHYFENMPVIRIASFLDLTVTTVKWRLYQGRQLMKRRLEGRWRLTTAVVSGSTQNERGEKRRKAGSPAADADAGRDRQAGAGGEPDRPARGRKVRRGAAV